VDRVTVDVYEARGLEWRSARQPVRRNEARRFGRSVPRGLVRADLGCGTGRYTGDLGAPVVALDAAATMVDACRADVPGALTVQGDLEALPFARHALHGAWASMSYLHLPPGRLPMALWDLHRAMAVGAPLDLQVLAGDALGFAPFDDDDFAGRRFARWPAGALRDVLTGAGFDVVSCRRRDDVVRARAVRARSLADTVAPGMRLLMCGLNPAIYAADIGHGFARRSNRFWKAAVAAGLTDRVHDPLHLLRAHRIGMTDVVKRATVAAAELDDGEYRDGMRRVERLVAWLEPGAVCFVGLAGWRAAVDRTAVAGPQPHRLGGRPVYVMPSTSGLNAGSQIDALAGHLRAALRLAAP
jgi:TDG/mug DNA glycosylase family protein